MNPNNQTYDINHRDKLYYTMGGNIPVKTKQKVLKLWLSGVSRKKIAEKVGIGEGTVTSIVQEAKEKYSRCRFIARSCNQNNSK